MRLKFKDGTGIHELDVQRSEDGLVMKVGEKTLDYKVAQLPNSAYLLLKDDHAVRGYAVRRKNEVFVHLNGISYLFRDVTHDETAGGAIGGVGEREITAPMPGSVIKILVNKGEKVKSGQALVIVEAMKMENEVRAAMDGMVDKVLVEAGQQVGFGEKLLELAPLDGEEKESS